MEELLKKASQYREDAEKVRLLAQHEKNHAARQALLAIAGAYEVLNREFLTLAEVSLARRPQA
jgi:hypothetical protein